MATLFSNPAAPLARATADEELPPGPIIPPYTPGPPVINTQTTVWGTFPSPTATGNTLYAQSAQDPNYLTLSVVDFNTPAFTISVTQAQQLGALAQQIIDALPPPPDPEPEA